MIRCPICHRTLSPSTKSPYAPTCSEACRREAMRRAGVPKPEQTEASSAQFEQFRATHLYCGTCRRSMPTNERLLLTLPNGELYGYTCAQCGTDVGTKTNSTSSPS